MNFWGDPIYFEKVLKPEESFLGRSDKLETSKKILSKLSVVIKNLEASSFDESSIAKMIAARIAMDIKD